MTLTCDKARWYEDSEGFWAAFRTRDRAAAEELARKVDGKVWSVEAKPERKRRSLDANAYLWVLLDKLAGVLSMTKEALYRDYIQQVGVFRDFHLTPEEAPTFETAWGRLGTGWLTERQDFAPDGDRVVIRAYYGSSQYSTKQMSRLIDMVVQDCKEQDIETMTPEELDRLKGEWGG